MNLDIVPSVSIENLLGQRDAIVVRLRAIHDTLNEAQTLAGVALGEAPYNLNLVIYGGRHTVDTESGIQELIKLVDAKFWGFLLDKSGLRTFLDAGAREKWDRGIRENNVPALTYENITATFKHLYQTRGDMFERGVVEVFRSLSWDYKTNSPRMFGKRIILTHAVEVWKHGGETHGPSHSGANKLDDLVRVFSVLDNHPEPDHRDGVWYTLNNLKWMAHRGGSNNADLKFFHIRGYKNSNAHVTFRRLDLVDKLNQILAKHYPNALPPEES